MKSKRDINLKLKTKKEEVQHFAIAGSSPTLLFSARCTLYKIMSKACQITGKTSMIGNNVSHSLRRTKRSFDVNLFTKKFYYVEEDCWIVLKVSAAGLRIINRIGLDAALKQAVAKGYVDWKDIEIIG